MEEEGEGWRRMRKEYKDEEEEGKREVEEKEGGGGEEWRRSRGIKRSRLRGREEEVTTRGVERERDIKQKVISSSTFPIRCLDVNQKFHSKTK